MIAHFVTAPFVEGGKRERKQENRPGAREKRKSDNRCAGKTAEKQRYAFSLEKMGKKALSYQTFTTAPRCEWEHHTTKASPCGDEPPQAQCAPAPPTGRAPKPFPCFAKGKEKTVKPRCARGTSL